MVTVETIHHSPTTTVEVSSSPRISFSAEFLEDRMGVVAIEPKSVEVEDEDEEEEEEDEDEDSGDDEGVLDLEKPCIVAEFEFLSTNVSLDSMLSADELFREGKLLPKFWLTEQFCEEKLENTGLKIESRRGEDEVGEKEKEEGRERGSAEANPDWFMDEDPSPRPPKCTVLWKELLRLRKQRAASSSSSCPPALMLLSPSSSSSSTSSSSSSMADVATKEGKDGGGGKGAKRAKKGGGLERTSSGTVRIRPMINVPICTVAKTSRLQQPPLFPLKKGRVEW